MRKVLTAGIMLSAVMLATGAAITGAGKPSSEMRTLFQPLDAEARTYLAANPHIASQDLDLFATSLVKKYEKNLTSITRTYRTTVYVSNVWNHAMDTYDKNPSMGKIWWYTAW